MSLWFRSIWEKLEAPVIKQLCGLTGLSIGEVRSRAAAGQALLEVDPFGGDWKEARGSP